MDMHNKLKKIHWETMEKIFSFLYGNNGVRRSHISMNARMSYDKCSRYLDWMSERNFIVLEKNIKTRIVLVKLTDEGVTFYNNVIVITTKK